jgi:superfamily II DNA or RNA helicase
VLNRQVASHPLGLVRVELALSAEAWRWLRATLTEGRPHEHTAFKSSGASADLHAKGGTPVSAETLLGPVASSIILRPYQLEAINAIFKKWLEYDRLLTVWPTGAGKTIGFAHVALSRIARGPVLILAHRDELIDQAINKLYLAVGIQADKEKAESYAAISANVVVGSVQTLSYKTRLKRFPSDHFKTVIVDEAHHILSESYQQIVRYFSAAKVLGVTATPDRGDAQSLGQYFEDIAHEVSLVDLIRGGYLAPITVRTVPLKIDISGVSTRAGDFSDEELAEVLDPLLEEIGQVILQYAAERKSVVFVPLVKTAERFAGILRGFGLRAEMISGQCSDRSEKLSRFRRGNIQVLVNSMLLTEGYDEPSIDCIVPLRPTKIRSLYAQQVGRGTRIHDGKKDLLLLDFLWHSRRHNLAKPASLIAHDEAESKRISRALAKGSGSLLVAQSDAARQREEALAAELEENRRRQGETVDLLELAKRFQAPSFVDYQPYLHWHHLAPTEPQVRILKANKIDPSVVRDRGHAAVVIDGIFKFKNREPATEKQLRYMKYLGHPNPFGVAMNKRAAGRWISARKAELQLQER